MIATDSYTGMTKVASPVSRALLMKSTLSTARANMTTPITHVSHMTNWFRWWCQDVNRSPEVHFALRTEYHPMIAAISVNLKDESLGRVSERAASAAKQNKTNKA